MSTLCPRPLSVAALISTGVLMAQPLPAAEGPAPTEARKAPEIVVIGEREKLLQIPGSGEIIEREVLIESRVFTVNEALRKTPGVYTRDEEGFGLRPNIGIRGLNPARSTKVLLLEDGLPLAYAPYGDNASYYHPPIDRFERIEVLKGSGQILFGPHTVGGVINYITPQPPADFGGEVTLEGGNRDFGEVRASLGDTLGSTGYFLNATRKQTDGVRDHMHFDVLDLNAKLVQEIGDSQALTLRMSWYEEDSDVTYSGLTLAEYQTDPRANPFVNDEFDASRLGSSLSHSIALGDAMDIVTSLYYTSFHRDWWRQSSNSGQRPNDSSDPLCAGMGNLSITCGNEGRLRDYWTAGLESRASLRYALFGLESEADFGVRYHEEDQHRLQVNSDSPNGRSAGTSVNAGLKEDSDRDVEAISGFIQNQFFLGDWTVTPGVRFESIDYTRRNVMTGQSGDESVEEWIPGIGVTYALTPDIALFAGAHRGFAPPSVADIISGSGASTELDAEESWNYEAGARGALRPGMNVELTLFRMDFENQVIPSSVAANACGASFCNAGETLSQGVEAGFNLDTAELLGTDYSVYWRAAWTWLADAEFRSHRQSSVGPDPRPDIYGNRLPYAPEHLLTTTLGYARASARIQLEAVYTDEMYGDDRETVTITANGQQGRLPSHTLWNAATDYRFGDSGWTIFATVKNLGDKSYVADMSRGMIPGTPRLVQAGFSYAFGASR